ncbi:unnamed protein product [Lota lota]
MPQTKSMDRQTVKQQTFEIVLCLFQDDPSQGCIETDGVGDGDDKFDPVPIANKLKEVADQMQKQWDKEFPPALLKFKHAHQKKDTNAAFSHAVDSVCQHPIVVEVVPEMRLINAAVALCLYLKSQAPELTTDIQQATTSFLDARVGSFVAEQGGWGAVARVMLL